MKIKVENVRKLIKEDFDCNLAAFSREMDIAYSTTWRTLGGKSNGLAKFIPALFRYCSSKGKDVQEYIEF